MTDSQMKQLLKHEPVKDFEDLLQYQCAKANHCDAIITFNKKDYSFSDIPTFMPKEYIIR